MELIHSTIRGFGLLKFYAAQSETHQSDAFNFRGLLDWGGEGGASINLPVVFRLWSRLPALSPANPTVSGTKGLSTSLLARLGVLGASVKEFSLLAETSASLFCSCFCKLSSVSISFRSSRCSTQTAFVGTLGFKFTPRSCKVWSTLLITLRPAEALAAWTI